MIARFFSTSKPIHLVLVTLYAFIIYCLVRFRSLTESIDLEELSIALLLFLVVFISISVLAFFVTKNNLTQRNSYKILFYVLFLAIIPVSLENNHILVSNLFIILALRRIFSLRNNLRVKKKLFDAAFWITMAALFHFWAILFFALIFAAILLFSIPHFKNWIIPLVGFLCVTIILTCYSIITTNTYIEAFNFIEPLNLDFSTYNDIAFVIGITIILSFGLWASFFYIKGIKDKPKQMRSSHVLVIYTAIIAFIIILISPDKKGGEFMFFFAPLAIIMTNFIEGVSERWFSEVFIWLLILTPLAKLLV